MTISTIILPVQIGSLSAALESVSDKTIIVADRIDEVKKVSGNVGVVENVLAYCRGDIICKFGNWEAECWSEKCSRGSGTDVLKRFCGAYTYEIWKIDSR